VSGSGSRRLQLRRRFVYQFLRGLECIPLGLAVAR
jgi:hypothetical protein